ncbi:hypothetical protein AQULUS_24250 (plasmid) [Aquicella lusitana]|uniref:Uncharacterized protein n=1 Tax=Aquicella lusitana TaxID=254246 RepID=A0A370GD66_9COXI|nr:hypothetical protein C8D86_12134 [Aquicella lusitana]VVC74659.1 hypothetical protein AQULUS_24250 [Aquicella lusitana]
MIKFIIRKFVSPVQNIFDYFRRQRSNRLMMSYALNINQKTQKIHQR